MANGTPIGIKIARRRQVLRLTQAQLAARLGVSKSTVANWELGKHYPQRYLGRLEDVLGVSLDGDTPEPDPGEVELRAALGALARDGLMTAGDVEMLVAVYRRRNAPDTGAG